MPGKILLVEDDSSLMAMYQTEFEANDYQVVQAKTSAEGLEKAKSEQPDVVLLDIMLPDGDGIATLRKLKADPETTAIPVVIITNFGSEELVKQALEGGAEDFILKYKVVPAEVVKKIAEVLRPGDSNGIGVTSE
ncbi:response regulator transcription factor [Candidatus Parcubacteria bacterium]|nr:response regulator transcription factor [Candidatus Parcubacteria bacterium]